MLRSQLVHMVRTEGVPVARASRVFGVSRDTAYRWLARYDADPHAELADRSRRPLSCPGRTAAVVEQAVLEVRQRFRWGARKIHAYLVRQGHDLPSIRTVHEILKRSGRVAPPAHDEAPLRFERSTPNDLWQVDHKCNIEIARRRFFQLTVLDDHSRFLLAMPPLTDRTITTAWSVLWALMGEFGIPAAILSDNAFSTAFDAPASLSWFDANCIRMGIRPVHGRPYHPQTQGKVERLHGTLEREFLPFADRSSLAAYRRDAERWRELYNSVRPHEAVDDAPPADRYRPSPRRRPSRLPEVQYPAGSTLRKVCSVGSVRWRRRRILAGRGLTGQWVRIHETDRQVELYFADTRIRAIAVDQLKGSAML